MGRVLGVDLGTRRVGLALTDPGRTIASPLQTIPFVSEARLAERLAAICRERDADAVVVGLPAGEGEAERGVAARCLRLAERLRAAGLAVHTWDESFSSREAEEALHRAGWRRARDPGRVDAVAASLVLRDWLDSRYTRRDTHD
jgi:putative Holliday junction resolvase